MRVEIAEIGPDVGVIVVDSVLGPVALVDPHLPDREKVRLLTELLSDEEFAELMPPLPTRFRLTAVR